MRDVVVRDVVARDVVARDVVVRDVVTDGRMLLAVSLVMANVLCVTRLVDFI